jgi:hypothetical protein
MSADSMSWIVFVLEFSKVLPIEGGEIFVPLTQGRPSENDIQVNIIFSIHFFYSFLFFLPSFSFTKIKGY